MSVENHVTHDRGGQASSLPGQAATFLPGVSCVFVFVVCFASSEFYMLVTSCEFHSGSSSEAFPFSGLDAYAYPSSPILPSASTLRFF